MGESSDPRYDFLQDFTLKSLRLKPDKWSRMIVSDEQRNFITNFVERPNPQVHHYTLTRTYFRYTHEDDRLIFVH